MQHQLARLCRLLIAAAIAASVTACTTTSTLPTAVDVDRKQNLVVPQGASDVVSSAYNGAIRSVYQVQGLLNNPSVQY